MKGRKPVPTRLKLVRGNPGKRAPSKNEPKPTGNAACPSWLDGYARSTWERMSKELRAIGLLTKVDRDAFACYCLAVERLKDATKILADEGLVIQTEKGQVAHPACLITNKAAAEIKAFAAEFGLTPSARCRIDVGPKAEDNSDEDFRNERTKAN